MTAAAALLLGLVVAAAAPADLPAARRVAADPARTAEALRLYDALPAAIGGAERVRLERADLALHLDRPPPSDLHVQAEQDRAYLTVLQAEGTINTGRFVEAEPQARAALAASAAAPAARDVFGARLDERAHSDLVQVLQATGKLDEARRRAEELAAAAATPFPGEPATRAVIAEGALGAVMFQQGLPADGWPHMRRSAELAVARLPARDAIRQAAVNNAAVAARAIGERKAARRWTDQLLADCPAGASGCDRATALVSRGMLEEEEGGERFTAERDFSEAAVIRANTLAPSDPRTAEPLNDLASLLLFRGATAEALEVQTRAVASMQAGYGRDAAATAQARRNLVDMLVLVGRADDALREADAGPGPQASPEVRALGLSARANARLAAGRRPEALIDAAAAVALTTPAAPSNVGAAASARRARLKALLALDRLPEAEDAAEELLRMARGRAGGGRVEEAGALLNLAHIRLARGENGPAREAAAAARGALPIWQEVTAPLTVEAALAPHAASVRDEAALLELTALWRSAGGRPDAAAARAAFATAQALFAHGTAEAADYARTLREAPSPEVRAAYLSREQAIQAYRKAGQAWAGSVAKGVPETQARTFAAFTKAGIVVDAADARLGRVAPRLDRLRGTERVDAAAIQASLTPDEAMLVLAVERPDAVHVFLLTHTDMSWRRAEVDGRDLCAVAVAFAPAAACGRPAAGAPPLSDALRGSLRAGASAAYDRAAAFRVWKALVAPVEPRLTGVRRLVQADAGEVRLPLSALVTKPPKGDDESAAARRRTSWVLDRWSVELVPAPGLLPLLRREQAWTAARGFLGVGAPCLAACGADDELARLPPLPAASIEIQGMASAAQGSVRMLLGPDATRRAVLGADLSDVGLVAFATHGLAGEGRAASEAALAVTPEPGRPDTARLTAADIAGNWSLPGSRVVMSACRTLDLEAARDVMAGLPRAFLASGASSVLVSFGAVPDRAAAELTRAASSPGRLADALRQSALKVKSDPSSPSNSDPRVWAVFAVVGDG